MTDPLLVDVYAGDLNGSPNWPALIEAGPPWYGAVLKATEGLHYAPSWFGWNWTQIAHLAGPRLGVDFFRGAYHYLRIGQDGAAQADVYCDLVGGWLAGDLPPIVDVERASNPGVTAEQVIATTIAFTTRVMERTGRACILYGGSLLADLGITDHMGCEKLWIARYTATLPRVVYERIGWQLEDLFGWQYCGDGACYLGGYPSTSPLGKIDITAVLAPNALAWMRAG